MDANTKLSREHSTAHAPGLERVPSDEGVTYPLERAPEEAGTIEVVPGLHWLRMPLKGSLQHINIWLVEEADGWTVVDTGIKNADSLARWETHFSTLLGDKPLTRVIGTHCHPDHVGLAGWLVNRTGAELVMTRGEYMMARSFEHGVGHPDGEGIAEGFQTYLRRAGVPQKLIDGIKGSPFGSITDYTSPLPVGFRRMQAGDTLTLGGREWQVVIGTGHSPEHACLYCKDEGVLISGDQVLPKISSNVGVEITEPFGDTLGDWIASICRLRLLPADTLVLPSHGEVFTGLHARLDRMLVGHARRLELATEACADPHTAFDLVPKLYTRISGPVDQFLALSEALAHLHYMETLGIVERNTAKPGHTFRTVRAFDAKTDLLEQRL